MSPKQSTRPGDEMAAGIEDVRERRHAIGWTQAELSIVAGVAIRTVRDIERGRARPLAVTLAAVIGALRKGAAEQAPTKRTA